MPYSTLVLIAAIASLGWYSVSSALAFLHRRRTIHDLGCQAPPSLQQRDPIFGLDVVLQLFRALRENRRSQTLQAQFAQHGHTFRSTVYGRTRIATVEPRNLQAVFATRFADWGVQPLRRFAFAPFVGRGIMCSDGAFWEHSRALIKPTFARAQIADRHLATYAAHVRRFLDLVPRDGSTVDLQPLFGRLALDSSTEFLFGESVGSLSPDTITTDAKSFLEAYNYGQEAVGRRLHLPQWNFLTRDRKFEDSCRIAHDFVDGYIAKGLLLVGDETDKEGAEPTRYILAHELIKETTNREDIRNQLLNVFLPAHDATGVALTNIFFNLARNPAVYTKLRQEICDTYDIQTPMTFERLKSLKYLQYVISESFRLNPAIGTNVRMALRDTILPTGGGPSGNGTSPIYVRKGDVVSFSYYALHRRKDVFGDDADVFRPERWETLRPPYWSYLPFSGGPRVCPGQQLALTEIGYTIVKILQTFKRIENRDPVLEFVELYKITTDSRNGAKLALILD